MTRRTLPFLLALLTAVLAGERSSAEGEKMAEKISFKARVENVTMLSRYEGEVRPVHVDPRYVIVVQIQSVSPEGKGIQASQKIAFAIHSPARTFHGDSAKGKTYDFSVERVEIPEGVRWRALRVETK